jgi:hypothetical protein
MYIWIIGGLALIIVLVPVVLRIAKIFWLTNFIAIYNMKRAETNSTRDALTHVLEFYSYRKPFDVLGSTEISAIVDAFEPIPGHERILGRLFLELDRKRDATILTFPSEVTRMAEVAGKYARRF